MVSSPPVASGCRRLVSNSREASSTATGGRHRQQRLTRPASGYGAGNRAMVRSGGKARTARGQGTGRCWDMHWAFMTANYVARELQYTNGQDWGACHRATVEAFHGPRFESK